MSVDNYLFDGISKYHCSLSFSFCYHSLMVAVVYTLMVFKLLSCAADLMY